MLQEMNTLSYSGRGEVILNFWPRLPAVSGLPEDERHYVHRKPTG